MQEEEQNTNELTEEAAPCIPTKKNLMKSSRNRQRKCFYAHYFCNRFENECGDFWTGACSRVESGQVKLSGGDEELR